MSLKSTTWAGIQGRFCGKQNHRGFARGEHRILGERKKSGFGDPVPITQAELFKRPKKKAVYKPVISCHHYYVNHKADHIEVIIVDLTNKTLESVLTGEVKDFSFCALHNAGFTTEPAHRSVYGIKSAHKVGRTVTLIVEKVY